MSRECCCVFPVALRVDCKSALSESSGCSLCAGGESHHQLPGVSGAADRGREAGGPLSGELRAGLPGCHG